MQSYLLSVTLAGVSSCYRPKISISADWVQSMGFVRNALVQAIPESNGIRFLLCNKQYQKYSELSNDTREKGGRLIKIRMSNKNSWHSPSLIISGNEVSSAGLKSGDPLIARYQNGFIHVRSLADFIAPDSELTEFILIKKERFKYINELTPTILIYRKWLSDFGFVPNTIVSVQSESNRMILKLQNNNINNYNTLVINARKSKTKIIQVFDMNDTSLITVSGSFVERARFKEDDLIIIKCDYGVLQLQKLSWEQLGFAESEIRVEKC
jgi:hypothetical protein